MSNLPHSGYDIDLGNHCSQNAYNWAKKTFANRQNMPGAIEMKVDGAFSNMLNFNGTKIGISSDGIGTKIELAERTGIYHTLGYDLVAMTADDLIASGFVPTNLSNIIDADNLDYDIIDALMRGLHDAANFAKVAITGGEIAELGQRIGGYGNKMHFNWCSTAIGILHPNLANPIDGTMLNNGDMVIALQSPGLRSNGFSAARRILQQNFGDNWHQAPYMAPNQTTATQTWGEVLLTPSLIYAPLISTILDQSVAISGIAHITGGGVADNFKRVLRTQKLGATLNNLFEPHDFILQLQQLGNINHEQAYTWWNMGNGMLFTVQPQDADKTLQIIAQYPSYKAQIAGYINNKAQTVQISNNGTLLDL
jgi:phosphoribosylformylglycinamidine cyclo-ligase